MMLWNDKADVSSAVYRLEPHEDITAYELVEILKCWTPGGFGSALPFGEIDIEDAVFKCTSPGAARHLKFVRRA
jgi:hypothetical protein